MPPAAHDGPRRREQIVAICVSHSASTSAINPDRAESRLKHRLRPFLTMASTVVFAAQYAGRTDDPRQKRRVENTDSYKGPAINDRPRFLRPCSTRATPLAAAAHHAGFPLY